jgi:ribosomal-protein-alanine N-acetyltransferase
MELRTERLHLRKYRETDIPAMVALLGAPEVAATTLRIPHPYTEVDARDYLSRQATNASSNWFAMFVAKTGELCGGVGLSVEEQHRRAELGYWIGVPYWGRGYATEAAREMLRYGFENLNLNRIFAGVFNGNESSMGVLKKIGMTYEGTSRQHFLKWGKFLDDVQYAILSSEWKAR